MERLIPLGPDEIGASLLRASHERLKQMLENERLHPAQHLLVLEEARKLIHIAQCMSLDDGEPVPVE